MNTRIVAPPIGLAVLVWMMSVGLSAAPAREAGGSVPQAPTEPADPVAAATPAEIIAAFSAALGEADREQAKRDRAELDSTFASVRSRIAARSRRSCGLSVPWRTYTSRFAAILARVGDAPDSAAAAERNHAMAGLQELDRFFTIAARYSADVCADDRELAVLKRQAQQHREDARARLGRVTDAVCRGTSSDRAALTALVHRHRPAAEQAQQIYDEVSVDLLDEIGRLKRSGTLCRTTRRAFLGRLPAIVVESYMPYRDPVGIKIVENAGIRQQLQRHLDERGAQWLKTYTVPPAGGTRGTGPHQVGRAADRPR